MGMVGGGRDAFIGGVHRIAAWMDGKIDLVAGAFSSNPEKSLLSLRPYRDGNRATVMTQQCSGRGLAWIYATTIFLSAFLLIGLGIWLLVA